MLYLPMTYMQVNNGRAHKFPQETSSKVSHTQGAKFQTLANFGLCVSLNENGPDKFVHLHAWSLIGATV